MLNDINIQGRLTKDPELRYTQTNTPVATFTLAVERDVKGPDGQRQADFITVVAWRHTGEFASKWFHKGDMAVVRGRLQVRSYEDKNGNKRTAAEVVADAIYFCANTHGNAEAAIPEKPAMSEVDDGDGVLPF